MSYMKERVIRAHNERAGREIMSFTLKEGVFIPDQFITCITCGKPVQFLRDQLSIQEFIISGTCQHCQDSVFGE